MDERRYAGLKGAEDASSSGRIVRTRTATIVASYSGVRAMLFLRSRDPSADPPGQPFCAPVTQPSS